VHVYRIRIREEGIVLLRVLPALGGDFVVEFPDEPGAIGAGPTQEFFTQLNDHFS
jgi:hypothetical protein